MMWGFRIAVGFRFFRDLLFAVEGSITSGLGSRVCEGRIFLCMWFGIEVGSGFWETL